MGEVHLMHDARLGRDVAMKVMRPEHITRPALSARFLREARAQGRLEHPSIVPVYDLSVQDRSLFFTMKRVHGATLAEVLARLRAGDRDTIASYSRHKLLSAFASVSLVVDFAHAQGVVHRDLKPENIMLGLFGELYVLDWGILKIVDPAGSAPASVVFGEPARGPRPAARTEMGALVGTPGFMAPEQLDPAIGPIDGRTDVYALGAILFEILTLEPLHAAPSLPELVASTLGSIDARPSVRAPGRHVPPELDEICVMATSRNPGDRFPSARALHEALERFREKDRDVEERHARAEEHAGRAVAVAQAAKDETDPDAPQRTLALREASRALAFDPSQARAFDVLRELLAAPPRALPPEVAQEQLLYSQRLLSTTSRGGAWLMLGWFAYLPLVLATGILDVRLYIAVSALALIAAATLWRQSKRAPDDAFSRVLTTSVVTLFIASLSVAWSPLMLVPSLAVALATTSIVSQRRGASPVIPLVAATAAILLPIALAEAGVVPPFFAYPGDRILILPRLFALPLTLTLTVSALTHIGVVVAIGAWCVHLRTMLDDRKRRLYMQVRQLRQLVPHVPATLPVPAGAFRPTSQGADEGLAATFVDPSGRSDLDAPISRRGDAPRYTLRDDAPAKSEGGAIYQDSFIGRQVATRTVPPDADAATQERFAREVRIQAKLEHPSIPPVYEMEVDDQGALRVMTRRLRGTTLATAIRRRTYSLPRLLEAYDAACQAVDYAHAKGIAHRGLRAEVVTLGAYGEVYVTGWESAVELEGADRQALVHADIAALGAILSQIAAPLPTVGADDAPLPSVLPVSGYHQPELDLICSTAVGPGSSFATVGQLREAVVRFLEGERDVERRRASSDEHARLAEAAAARAFAGSPQATEDRAAAMREVNQALALDGANVQATAVLMRLLTLPPAELSAEAEREMQDAADADRRRASRLAGALYLSVFLHVPFTFLLGLRSVSLLVLFVGTFVAAAFAFWRAARAPVMREEIGTVVLAMTAAAVLAVGEGPLIMVPILVVVNTMGFLLQIGPKRRWLVLSCGCLALVVPLALQGLGVVPPFYASEDGGVAILPWLVDLPRIAQMTYAFQHILLLAGAGLLFTRFRNTLSAAAEGVHLNGWQLRQLVPVEARDAAREPQQGLL